MQYIEVVVADSSFKGTTPLTYSVPVTIKTGVNKLVTVPLKQKQVLGIVTKIVPRPAFPTKPIIACEPISPLPPQVAALAQWITTYYPAGIGVTLQHFLPTKLYPISALPPLPDATTPLMPLPLTAEQSAAIRTINKPDTYILHGVTGSGKTRVYIELALRALANGTSAIILTPEIGLTPQLTQNFTTVFGDRAVVTIHSKLTAKERNLIWLRILESTIPLVILGPRSALFAPVRAIGVIILDESHESAYKQEQSPHYHASKVAAMLAQLHRAPLILGSATPSITDYYVAQIKNKKIIQMRATALPSDSSVTIDIVDLKNRAQFTRQPHLSNLLLDSMARSLQRGEQSLLFLNRRGTARVVLCENCGWQAVCPHCDLPLTYHSDTHVIRCHTCGHSQTAPHSCPDCKKPDIILKSIGTKAIVDAVERSFPQARIRRFDTDNTKEERLEAHYTAVVAGNVDIIIGTQLIAKGLDLPKLSTIGVIVADTSLYLPDYTAAERSYQLLRQVIGRVGRGHLPHGNVIIQTYEPESSVITAAAQGDWETFYAAEIAERQQFMFPPFCHTLKIWCRRATSSSAQRAAEQVVATLRASGLRLMIDGPLPAFHEKQAGKYQWQANLRAKDRQQLIQAIKLLPANWFYDIDPSNLL